MISEKHPTNHDGTCNWRKVYGPPIHTRTSPVPSTPRARLARALDSMADSVRIVLIAAFDPESLKKRPDRIYARHSSSTARDTFQDIDASQTAAQEKTVWKRFFVISRPFRVLFFCLAVYGIGFCVARVTDVFI